MKKNSLLSSVLITFLILGAGCNSSSPTRSVSGTSSVGESASTISETSTKSNNPGSEYRYYAGTIGAKRRLRKSGAGSSPLLHMLSIRRTQSPTAA
jgi:hypothetical protein